MRQQCEPFFLYYRKGRKELQTLPHSYTRTMILRCLVALGWCLVLEQVNGSLTTRNAIGDKQLKSLRQQESRDKEEASKYLRLLDEMADSIPHPPTRIPSQAPQTGQPSITPENPTAIPIPITPMPSTGAIPFPPPTPTPVVSLRLIKCIVRPKETSLLISKQAYLSHLSLWYCSARNQYSHCSTHGLSDNETHRTVQCITVSPGTADSSSVELSFQR